MGVESISVVRLGGGLHRFDCQERRPVPIRCYREECDEGRGQSRFADSNIHRLDYIRSTWLNWRDCAGQTTGRRNVVQERVSSEDFGLNPRQEAAPGEKILPESCVRTEGCSGRKLDPFFLETGDAHDTRRAPPQVKLASPENQEKDDDQDNSAEADIHKKLRLCRCVGKLNKPEHFASDCKLSRKKKGHRCGK
jgi:hypothetical protein